MKLPNHFLILSFSALIGSTAYAHCDGWDGPVVQAAQKSLDKADVNLALIWVRDAEAPAIREAFNRTLEVRKLGGEARRLADQFFFETLVRLHRAGEGAPYSGLKPAGRDLGPAITAGDMALETGDLKPVWKLMNDTAHHGLHHHFEAVYSAKAFPPNDLEAGRRFTAAYADFIHYVESLYAASKGPSHKEEGHAKPAEGCRH